MKPAGQMTLTLTPELEQFVRDEVRRGAFASSSEYVRDLVRERYMKERDRAAKLKALDAALARGIADAQAAACRLASRFGRDRAVIASDRLAPTEMSSPRQRSIHGDHDAT